MPKKPRNELKARIAARKKERKALARKQETDYLGAFELLQRNACEIIMTEGVFSAIVYELQKRVGKSKVLAAEQRGYLFIREVRKREHANLLLGNLSPTESNRFDGLVKKMVELRRQRNEGGRVDTAAFNRTTGAATQLVEKALCAYLAKGLID